MEVEFNLANTAMAMLLNQEFGDIGILVSFLISMVIVNTMQHNYKVGVLLDRAGFTKIR